MNLFYVNLFKTGYLTLPPNCLGKYLYFLRKKQLSRVKMKKNLNTVITSKACWVSGCTGTIVGNRKNYGAGLCLPFWFQCHMKSLLYFWTNSIAKSNLSGCSEFENEDCSFIYKIRCFHFFLISAKKIKLLVLTMMR